MIFTFPAQEKDPKGFREASLWGLPFMGKFKVVLEWAAMRGRNRRR